MSEAKSPLPGIAPYAFGLGVAALSLVALAYGKDLLIPLAVAVMIWYLLNALSGVLGRVTGLPRWASLGLALVVVLGLLAAVVNMISANVAQVTVAAPSYQANVIRLFGRVGDLFGPEYLPNVNNLVGQINLAGLIRRIAATLTALVGNAGIILLYVLFLLIEQHSFDAKLKALFRTPGREMKARRILSHIQSDIQTYVAVKTLVSLATAAISYGILLLVGVDYAAFWALLIFLLNYIPTIGSLIATVFPALLALVQFDTVIPALVVLLTIGAVQVIIGNLIEPRVMGRSLNLSPLVVLLSLALWGSLWGIVGMFLCVPLTVVAMIVFSNFDATRPVAVLLSGDGKIDRRDD